MKKYFLYSLAIVVSVGFFAVNAQNPSETHTPLPGETVEVSTNDAEVLSDNMGMADTLDTTKPVVEKTEADRADSLYAVYESLVKSNVTGDRLYYAVDECSESCMKVLNDTALVAHYITAKSRLRTLRPTLMIGGIAYSQRNNTEMAVSMLEKYILIPKHDFFKDEAFENPSNYPQLVYYVASNKFNAKEFSAATVMLEEYLLTHDKTYESKVYTSLAKAYGFCGQGDDQILTLMKGAQKLPNDMNILHDVVEYHIMTGNVAQAEVHMMNYERLEKNQSKVLSLKSRIHELNGDYRSSLTVCEQLYALDTNNIDNIKRFACASFNYVLTERKNGKVDNFGKPLPELYPYLENASKLLVQVVDRGFKGEYLKALIDAYVWLDRKEEARVLAAKNGEVIDTQRKAELLAEEPMFAYAKANVNNDNGSRKVSSLGVPIFPIYAYDYVAERLMAWRQKGTYEKTADYELRTSGESLKNKRLELINEAKKAYIDRYSITILASLQKGGIKLSDYDADNEVYKLSYNLGYMLVKVPMANNEAQNFSTAWEKKDISIKNPKFDVVGDTLVLAGLDFISISGGPSYKYDMREELAYEDVDVTITNPIGLGDILDENLLARAQGQSKQTMGTRTIGGTNKKSDVDIDVPVVTDVVNDNTFALIISNEHYDNTVNVECAIADGRSFANYCTSILGLPEKNVMFVSDASYLQMKSNIKMFTDVLKAYGTGAKAVIYYSGHGVPDYSTSKAYFLSKDADPKSLEGAFSMSDFYANILEAGAEHVNVFLDCCFSGGTRSGEMLYAARGVVVDTDEEELAEGNMIVLTACSGVETALPYTEKGHGLFTYFLLKKLKETKGDVTMGELYDYVKENVSRRSTIDHKKSQTPDVMPSDPLMLTWKNIKIRN